MNLELPWNPVVLEQRIGRIYRLGQTKPIDVYNLVTDEGIESRIAQLVSNKRAVFNSLFDGTTDEVSFDGSGSFLEGVKKLVDGATPPMAAVTDADDDADADVDAEAPASERPSASDSAGAPAPVSLDVIAALAKLSLSPLPEGGLRIDAPREIAAPLADMFERLARSLREVQ